MKANINPSSQVYKEFYLEDRNFITFSSTLGVRAFADIEEIIIETDDSLMPYADIVTEKLIHVSDSFISAPFIVTATTTRMANIIIKKSPKIVTYHRKFNKLDDYLSYVGGLVGTIIGLLFIMRPYTERAYEVSLAKKVLLDNDNKGIESNSFNMGYFIIMQVKRLLNFFKCDPNWPKMQLFTDSCSEVSSQIDITYMVRKLMFLDAAISQLMEKH